VARDNSIVNVDREALGEFLDLKGGVELLVVLSDGEVPYSEFEDQVPVSKSTFHIRREKAVDLQLIDSNRRQTDGGFENVYGLTSLGEVVTRKVREQGLVKIFWRLQELQKQYDELREDVPSWVRDESVDFSELHMKQTQYGNENTIPDSEFY